MYTPDESVQIKLLDFIRNDKETVIHLEDSGTGPH